MLTFKRVNITFLVLIVLFTILKIKIAISFWILLLILFMWLLFTALGSFNIRWNYFLTAHHKNDKVRENVIALTFDDGPHPEFTPMVLELLQKFDAKATFFLIGKNVEKYPDLVKDIVNKGHIIGNHSYKHSNNYGFLSTNSLISDLNKNKQLIYDTVGLKMKFFRPPFGVTNPKITKAILSLKLKTFGWSIRTYDTTAKKTEVIVSRVKAKLKKGEVILMHDTSKKSVEALDKVLNYMNEKNLKSITLTQLFSYEAYEK